MIVDLMRFCGLYGRSCAIVTGVVRSTSGQECVNDPHLYHGWYLSNERGRYAVNASSFVTRVFSDFSTILGAEGFCCGI